MLNVLLIQLPVPSSPQLNTPLAAGYLKAYAAAQGLLDRVQIDLLPRELADRAGDAALVAAIVARRPDLLGLSLYTWNSERSLELARRAKALLPGLIVVAGGPEVQPDNRWLLEHPGLDIAVIGEGEQTFADLLGMIGDSEIGDSEIRDSEIRDSKIRDSEIRDSEIRDSKIRETPNLVSPNLESPNLESLNLESLNLESPASRLPALLRIPGLAWRGAGGRLIFTGGRGALGELEVIPSPYLAGYLEQPADGVLLVEVSRWCPYSCSFCLYGRNMGPRLGGRSFGLGRVLAEVAWGKARGVRRFHFVEANLNLVPIFWPLMRALAELNADRALTFYAELRGEHLSDAVVAALDAANVRVVEVGLQTANPAALRASSRRTDLAAWAAGARRLYGRKIEVLLDVILGLPEDDAAGVAATLAFIEREGLGPYDIFTLQVLPGTAVRREAARHGMRSQDRPPYYVLGTDRLGYAELRRLRRELKLGAGLDPDAVEGLPAPRPDALAPRRPDGGGLVDHMDLRGDRGTGGQRPSMQPPLAPVSASAASGPLPVSASGASGPAGERPRPPFAAHVDLLLDAGQLAEATPLVARWVAANPSTVFDLYMLADARPPAPGALRAWRDGLPFTPGYLDRVAVYRRERPDPPYLRVSPRMFLVLPWRAAVEPDDYGDAAAIIWRSELGPGDGLPLGAWRAAGGAGIWLTFEPGIADERQAALVDAARDWAEQWGRMLYF